MTKHRQVVRQDDALGFSLIELLVVVLIIAILAAIAIPFFLNQRERSFESQAVSALKNASTAMESYASNNSGNYPDTDATEPVTDLVNQGYRVTANVVLTIEVGDVDNYCLQANHTDLAIDWRYRANEGVPSEGSCP
jgi:type IV pilus assembly protein PilA